MSSLIDVNYHSLPASRLGFHQVSAHSQVLDPASLLNMDVVGKVEKPYHVAPVRVVSDVIARFEMSSHCPRVLRETLNFTRNEPTLFMLREAVFKFATANVNPDDLDQDCVRFADEVLERVECPKMDCSTKIDFKAHPVNESHYDMTTNPGYIGSVIRGNKSKRDDFAYSVDEAKEIVSSSTIKRVPWLVFGKGVDQLRDVKKKTRLICGYAFCNHIVADRLFKDQNEYLSSRQDTFFGPGFSWYNGGAKKLADYFGQTPDEITLNTFDECDFSGYDFSQSEFLIYKIRDWRKRRLHDVGNVHSLVDQIYHDVVHAKLLLPDGLIVRKHKGMASGFTNTASDNTLMHYWLIAYVYRKCLKTCSRRRLKRLYRYYGTEDHYSIFRTIRMKLYGDDHLSMKSQELSKVMPPDRISSIMQTLGFVVKPEKFKRCKRLSDCTYLGRSVKKLVNGNIIPYRPTTDTTCRLLYGSVAGPRADDVSMSLARYIGLYYDNFFNATVRTLIERLFDRMRSRNVLPTWGKLHSKRMRDLRVALGGSLPTHIPTRQDVERLYGVNTEIKVDESRCLVPKPQFQLPYSLSLVQLNSAWLNNRVMLDIDHVSNVRITGGLSQAPSCSLSEYHSLYQEYFNLLPVGVPGNQMTRRVMETRMRAHYRTAPFARSAIIAGNAGMKVFEAMHLLRMPSLSSIADFGSHPGSAINAIKTYHPDSFVWVVSKHRDPDVPFCYKVNSRRNIRFYQGDYRNFITQYQGYDYVNCDIAADERAESHSHAELMSSFVDFVCANRRLKYATVKYRGFTSDNAIDQLYKLYKKSGRFILFKPAYSYPWNSEVVACCDFTSKRAYSITRAAFVEYIRQFAHRYLSVAIPFGNARLSNDTSRWVNPAVNSGAYQRALQRSAFGQLIDQYRP